MDEYIFAFDDWNFRHILEEKIELLQWVKDWKLKFFVYVNPLMNIGNTIKKIEYLKNIKALPYIMRDISCWNSEFSEFYTDIAAYCNQVSLFKKMTFKEFVFKRYNESGRSQSSWKIWNNNS
jgi:hypothetical protein